MGDGRWHIKDPNLNQACENVQRHRSPRCRSHRPDPRGPNILLPKYPIERSTFGDNNTWQALEATIVNSAHHTECISSQEPGDIPPDERIHPGRYAERGPFQFWGQANCECKPGDDHKLASTVEHIHFSPRRHIIGEKRTEWYPKVWTAFYTLLYRGFWPVLILWRLSELRIIVLTCYVLCCNLFGNFLWFF